MKSIIISSDVKQNCCLGHELHVTRCVIIDMLLQSYINENDVIVVKNSDKKFLYAALFKNVLTYCQYIDFIISIDQKEYNIIDLSPINQNPDFLLTHISIPNFNFSPRYYSDEFKRALLKINFRQSTDLILNKDFIVIHRRYDEDIQKLKMACEKFLQENIDLNIIIFNNDINELKKDINYNNVILIDNLQLYATYLNDNKCRGVISEWSGGGQVAQYCCNKKTIMYYFNHYQSQGYIPMKDQCIANSMSGDYLQSWDFKNPGDSTILMFNDFNDLLNNIPTNVINAEVVE